jgi:branched-chain amino acid transport system substrate-binding protein
LGEDVRRGFELYLEEKGGKLAGRAVEIIDEDGEGNPQVSIRKFRQVVLDQDADFIIAGDSSSVLYALRDEIEKNNKIMLVPIAAGNEIAWDLKSEYVYRLIFSNWQGGTTAAEYSANHLGKKAIVVASDYPGGDEALASFKAAFEANGGEIVETFRPPQGANDYASFINQMAQIEADFVFCFLVGSDSVRFLTQFHDAGMKDKLPLISAFTFSEPSVFQAVGEGALGVLSSTPYSPWLDNELNTNFVNQYKEKYSLLPTQSSVAGYDAGQLIEKVVEETGSLDPDVLKEAIKGMTIDSPRGPLTIDPETHDPVQNFYIVKTVEGDDGMVLEVVDTYEQIKIPAERPAE